jgi:3-phenylpropionate/trans-cinnamate dioxygenase ferredoxin subunit
MEQATIRYVRVAALDGIPSHRGRPAFVDGKVIALFRVGGDVYALDDSCPHAGSSLSAGRLNGAVVACPTHGLRFDVRTGRMCGIDGLCVKSYPARVVDGAVEVGIESARPVQAEGDGAAKVMPAATSCAGACTLNQEPPHVPPSACPDR